MTTRRPPRSTATAHWRRRGNILLNDATCAPSSEASALVEAAPSPGRPVRVVDGRVQVKVLLRNTHALTLHRLEAAGLRLHQVAARWVVGSIEVTKLAALAERDGVERVELP